MKKLLLCAIILFCTIGLFAQEEGPDEPELILPEKVLDIQDITAIDIEVSLPLQEIQTPQIETALPRQDEIEIPDDAFTVELDTDIDSGTPQAASNEFYSEGELGFGTMNHILGSISLYKLGNAPRFKTRFFYEGRDGYWAGSDTGYTPAGSGAFSKAINLEGAFILSAENIEDRIELMYSEQEEGLQDISPVFYSIVSRYISGANEFSYLFADNFRFEWNAYSEYSSFVYTGTDAGQGQELAFATRLLAATDFDRFNAGVFAGYGLENGWFSGFTAFAHTPSPIVHDIHGGLEVSLDVNDSFLIDGSTSVLYDFSGDLYFPFKAGFTAGVPGAFILDAEGGYVYEYINNHDLWERIPVTAPLYEGTVKRGWSVLASMSMKPVKDFRIKLGGVFEELENSFWIDSSLDTSTGLADYSFGPGRSLVVTSSVDWNPVPEMILSAAWDWSVFDRSAEQPLHEILIEATWEQTASKFGAGLTNRVSVRSLDVFPVPETGLSGFWRPGEGIKLEIAADDILGLFLENGRRRWGGYLAPGSSITIKTQVSL